MTFKCFSLGCKVNSYECSAIRSLLLKNNYKEDNNNPDVVILNTCSVTSTADQKSRQHIRKFLSNYPNAIIVVMGCYSQGNGEFIFNEIKPHIVLGTKYRNEIPSLIQDYYTNHERILKIDDSPRFFKYEELGITSHSENIRAYLKIQDGCNNFCSYCIIPFRRGVLRSRGKQEILDEAKYLISVGYKEIVLCGIHVGGYGQDNASCSFSTLVDELTKLDGLESLRISSIEESEIDDKLIELIKNRNNIAKHLHIPLQAGSNSVLKRMNRKYTQEEFVAKIDLLRRNIPDLMISSDIIVGFPGESEEDFLETMKVANHCFDSVHVFPFSPRSGTLAAKMNDQISPQIKNDRAKRLISLSSLLYEKFVDRFIGKSVEVLIEQYDIEKDINIGHTSNYIEVCLTNLHESLVSNRVKIKLEKSMIQSKKI